MVYHFVFVVLAQITLSAKSLISSPFSTTSLSDTLTLDQQTIGNSKIFGIRWMLGNSFSLEKEYRNSERFVMMFNSHSKIPGNVILKI
jgi:hypothetical protein